MDLLRPEWHLALVQAVPPTSYNDLRGINDTFAIWVADQESDANLSLFVARSGDQFDVIMKAFDLHKANRPVDIPAREHRWRLRSISIFGCVGSEFKRNARGNYRRAVVSLTRLRQLFQLVGHPGGLLIKICYFHSDDQFDQVYAEVIDRAMNVQFLMANSTEAVDILAARLLESQYLKYVEFDKTLITKKTLRSLCRCFLFSPTSNVKIAILKEVVIHFDVFGIIHQLFTEAAAAGTLPLHRGKNHLTMYASDWTPVVSRIPLCRQFIDDTSGTAFVVSFRKAGFMSHITFSVFK